MSNKSIIEKLGITPAINFKQVREKEVVFDEMLEALILMMDEAERLIASGKKGKPNPALIALIEKACYPKKWPEIKDLLNE